MFIVWGTKGFINDLGETVQEANCPKCNNFVRWRGTEVGKRFTLFWIPLFKTSAQHYLSCPICQCGLPTSKETLQQQLLVNQTNPVIDGALQTSGQLPSSTGYAQPENYSTTETAYAPYSANNTNPEPPTIYPDQPPYQTQPPKPPFQG